MKNRRTKSNVLQALIIAVVCCFAFTLCLTACGSSSSTNPTSPSKPSSTLENSDMKIEGVFIDSSYDGSSAGDDIKRLYIFSKITASTGTKEVSSASFNLSAAREKATDELDSSSVIQRDSDSGRDLAQLASSYTCTNVITKITPGSSANLIIPFNVPSYYLQDGASFSLSDSYDISNGIKFGFDVVQTADSKTAIAQSVDSDGYAKTMAAREDASPETAQDVKDRLNQYEFFESVGGLTQKYYFEGDSFTFTAMGKEVTGTYVVKNGYLACTQDSTGWVNWVPWEFSEKSENGISIDIGGSHVEK